MNVLAGKPKVTVIPATKPKAAPEKTFGKKLRVAAYCRVSSEKDEQLNSFEVQVNYYTEKISNNPDWVLVDIYADATCIIGTNQSPSRWAAICPYFSCFQSIWRRHTR